MKISEKLRIILKITAWSQETLARQFDVTFVTLNTWINNKSEPRQKKQILIDELYLKLTGQAIIPKNILQAKKELIKQKAKNHHSVLELILKRADIYNSLLLSLTYNTNSIEGSTLSENETATVLFDDKTLPNKTLIEQLEVKNHQAAFDYLLKYISDKNSELNEDFILNLHSKLMNGIQSDAGFYRRHGVRIVGSHVPTANYLKIDDLISALTFDLKSKTNDLIYQIADIHSRFEQIHPFSDGNGRVGRLLLNAMLLRADLPPAMIQQEVKHLYYKALQKGQLDKDLSLLEDFIVDAILLGFKIINE